jgi:peptide/nickel transport system substrate-binding protein
MLSRKRFGLYLAIFTILALVLVACQPQTQTVEVTRIVTETEVVEGEAVEVTRVVTETEEVVVTATPAPEVAASFVAPDPTTYTNITFGDINTLDPALAYDTASSAALDQIMEGLVTYNFTDGTTYVPLLATEVPSAENGGISEDGLVYTFNIREGVTYHQGGTLEPHDVAYTFQRGLLQSDPNGPQWLLLEPILGYTHGDVTEEISEGEFAGDREALIAGATPEELAAVCEKVQAAVVADDAAGTVTFNLAQPWGPFISTLAGTWGHIIDMEWAVEQGAWDGDCATWQNFYSPGAENSELTSVVNGTGPYMMESWTPGEQYVLVSNENYWVTEPLWEGGHTGPPAIKTVIVEQVEEWGTRFAALQAGDAEVVAVNIDVETQVDPLVGEFCDWQTFECTPSEENPDGPLRKWDNLPQPSRTDAFLNWNIPPDSPYIGSGQLDGNGIPPNFFSDLNVRKAMATCFDYDTYIAEALNGKGVRNNGPIILDMLGYNPDGPMYEYNPEECAAFMEQAHGGVLPETGFRFQMAYNSGNTVRQTVGAIFQSNFEAINELYQVEVVGLPWPTFLRASGAGQFPAFASGWIEDIHDPHNWAQPFTLGTFAGRAGLPEELTAQFQELVTAAATAPTPEEREAIYFDIQQLYYDQAVAVTLAQSTTFRFEQRWVDGWYYRVGAFAPNYYEMSLNAE